MMNDKKVMVTVCTKFRVYNNGDITMRITSVEVEPEIKSNHLERSIDELNLSVRSYNSLKNAELNTVADIVGKNEEDLMKVKTLGKKSLREIKEVLGSMGLELGKVEPTL